MPPVAKSRPGKPRSPREVATHHGSDSAQPEGVTLLAVLRRKFGSSGKRAKRWIAEGRAHVDGVVVRAASAPVPDGAVVDLGPAQSHLRLEPERVLLLDRDLVVVDKPPGVSTVPFDKGERGTLVNLVQRHLARADAKGPRRAALPSIHVVQRLDKGTSGVLVFARSRTIAEGLRRQLRAHSMVRQYQAVVHGVIGGGTYRSHLVTNRGDGMRGSWEHSRSPAVRRAQGGKLAVTHVEVFEGLRGATLLGCRLETGRTNQIRIHLSEAGHPLLGDRVYMRGFAARELPAPRLMLHAASLAFEHPRSSKTVSFDLPLPEDMQTVVAALR